MPDRKPDIRIGSEPDIRIGLPNRIPNRNPTDGRTDGRTNEDDNYGRENRTVVDASAQARNDGPVKLGEVIESGFMREQQRHPTVRIGERAEIPGHVRAAVWYRDRGRCELCPPDRQPGVLHLDHIVPWSAGGIDATTNLRLLCEWHNQDRSNWIDHARPKRAATWWCALCYGPEAHWQYINGLVLCPRHPRDYGPYVRCRVARRYLQAKEAGEPATWHERARVTSTELIAYCAHCNRPSVTDVTL